MEENNNVEQVVETPVEEKVETPVESTVETNVEEKVETPVEEVVQTVVEPVEETDKKKKNIKTLIILVAIVAVLSCGVWFLYKKFFNPKSMFINAVNNEYAKFFKLFIFSLFYFSYMES